MWFIIIIQCKSIGLQYERNCSRAGIQYLYQIFKVACPVPVLWIMLSDILTKIPGTQESVDSSILQ